NTCVSQSIAAGMPCPGGQTGVCDATGACVTCTSQPMAGCTAGEYCFGATCASCSDGVTNGDESDIDCGGSNCKKCGAGQACKIDMDCGSQHCADGLCCDTACTDACSSCLLPGLVGTCTIVSWGQTTSKCMGNNYCNQADTCVP